MNRRPLAFHLQDEEAQIDMTPMLDIVFIMLIFFIVSTAFVRESGVEIHRPEAQSATPEKPGVMIAVTDSGEIWLDRKVTDLRMIRPTLERMKVADPELGVLIQADEASNTGVLIKVLDQVRLSGIAQVAVAAQKGGQ